MKAKKIEWSGLTDDGEFHCFNGMVGGMIAYRLYFSPIDDAGEQRVWVSSNKEDVYGLRALEFISVNEAKVKCEEDLERYVGRLQKQLQWLGENDEEV